MNFSTTVNPAAFSTCLPGWSDVLGWKQAQQYLNIACADIDGDGLLELISVTAAGLVTANHLDAQLGVWNQIPDSFTLPPAGTQTPPFPAKSRTIFFADVDGDGLAEMLIITSTDVEVWGYNAATATWNSKASVFSAFPMPPNVNYASFQAGDIDNDGCAEVLFMTNEQSATLMVWDWQTLGIDNVWLWVPLASLPLSTGYVDWTQPAMYQSLRIASSNGVAQVWVRDTRGFYCYEYSASTKLWTQPGQSRLSGEPNGPLLTTSDFTPVAFQLADVNGDGSLELVAESSGLYVFSLDTATQSWTPTFSASPNGPAEPSGYSGIDPCYCLICADVDGDKKAEIVIRGSQGVFVYHVQAGGSWSLFGPSTGPALPLADSAGYDAPEYGMTIQCADVNNDGAAELFARAPDGMHSWQCEAATGTWSKLSADFPVFTGDQLTAFQYISEQLMDNVKNADLRTQYGNLDQDLDTYQIELSSLQRPSTVSQADWEIVVGQLMNELKWASDLQKLFINLQNEILSVFVSQDVSLDTIASKLELSDQQKSSGGSAIWANLLTLFGNLVWTFCGLPEAKVFGVVGGLFASAAGFGASFLNPNPPIPNRAIQAKYPELKQQLSNTFSNLNLANGSNAAAALADYGWMATVGPAMLQGQWAWPTTLSPDVTETVKTQYSIWLYQVLTPLVWQIYIGVAGTTCSSYPANWIQQGTYVVHGTQFPCLTMVSLAASDNSLNCLHPSLLLALSDAPTDGLGVSPSDVLNGQNGWNMPVVNTLGDAG